MSNNHHTPDNEGFQMLNQSEFARLMNVCVGTVRNWRESGALRQGSDYLKKGNVIRFPYSLELMQHFMLRFSDEAPRRPQLKSRQLNRRALKLKA